VSTPGFSSLKTDAVGRDDWIFGGVGLLLVIDLLFLPWFSISAGPFSAHLSGTDAPDGWLGFLAVLATVAAVVDLGIERLAADQPADATRKPRRDAAHPRRVG
jgi:hypothetical protein